MIGLEAERSTAENYRSFAEHAARGQSPRYEQWARGIAEDGELLAFLHRLPPDRRQPTLFFAALRWVAGLPADLDALRAVVRGRGAELERALRTRRTQTNEAGRCAVLLPALAQLPQPLALLEVGASAGLTLLPDRYGYDYAGHRLDPPEPGAPVLPCRPRGPVPLPAQPPRVVWRAGIDQHPLRVDDTADTDWLRALVWPGQPERARRLEAAVIVARRDPPPVHRGDLVDDLAALARAAPPEATLVVFHTAVLPYVDPERRRAFAAAVRGLGARWIANEPPTALDGIADAPADGGTDFALTRDGSPLAQVHSHGAWIRWLGD
ncbi:hypothetical protein GCM10027174_18870 [Salinifilum aidingensis]